MTQLCKNVGVQTEDELKTVLETTGDSGGIWLDFDGNLRTSSLKMITNCHTFFRNNVDECAIFRHTPVYNASYYTFYFTAFY